MGKKSKHGAKPNQSGPPRKEATTKAVQNGDSAAATNLVGLSKQSKKIKKQEKIAKKELKAPVAAVVEHQPELVQQAKKKKKEKKHKKEAEDAPPTVAQETKPVANDDDHQQVSEKKKKKKNKHKTGEDKPAESQQPETAEVTATNGQQKKHKKKKQKKAEVVTEEVTEEVPKLSKKDKKKQKKQKQKEQKQQSKAIEADKDVVTSESESEDEPMEDASAEMDKINQSILSEKPSNEGEESSGDEQEEEGAKKSDNKTAAKEEKKERKHKGPEHSIFIGNVPTTMKKSAIKTLFNQYGKILTIRFRTHDGVVLFHTKDRKDTKALICYVRFETKQAAEAACAMNGQMIEGNRVRVSLHSRKQHGHDASTVFVGNIHRNTTDNELYDYFARVGELEYVRQIAGKGFGYVCFKKGVSIAKALKLNQQLLNGRPLRIMKVDPNRSSSRRNKKGNLVKKNKLPGAGGGGGGAGGQKPANGEQQKRDNKQKSAPKEFHGTVAKGKFDRKHKHKSKGGQPDKKKKLLAQKLKAAGTVRNK